MLDLPLLDHSRMESNGLAGRIHVSQATADVLKAAGRGSWLTPREEKIVAKGKGELQTYFVSIPTKVEKSTLSVTDDDSSSADRANSGHLDV